MTAILPRMEFSGPISDLSTCLTFIPSKGDNPKMLSRREYPLHARYFGPQLPVTLHIEIGNDSYKAPDSFRVADCPRAHKVIGTMHYIHTITALSTREWSPPRQSVRAEMELMPDKVKTDAGRFGNCHRGPRKTHPPTPETPPIIPRFTKSLGSTWIERASCPCVHLVTITQDRDLLAARRFRLIERLALTSLTVYCGVSKELGVSLD
ncbi:hypothetical protein CIRG_02673 [Coccidioides immitis RMSCC 2394]|uniref:Uncharacterized protein n=1 Tax=Coccidioides immitis RMSCC 2394 TaxID=404692 RepID=A0A0J6Y2W1_COCIT|nr:hypothetical protein CIRG_02673 [Coccidioides immitis RMSCC 2394]